MPKQKKNRISKSKAIQTALDQLGWHVSGKDVVAFLANYGIEVNEGLVQSMKVDSLTDSIGIKRRKEKVSQQVGQRPVVHGIRKTPAQRSYKR